MSSLNVSLRSECRCVRRRRYGDPISEAMLSVTSLMFMESVLAEAATARAS